MVSKLLAEAPPGNVTEPGMGPAYLEKVEPALTSVRPHQF